jgi:hypothetical protein
VSTAHVRNGATLLRRLRSANRRDLVAEGDRGYRFGVGRDLSQDTCWEQHSRGRSSLVQCESTAGVADDQSARDGCRYGDGSECDTATSRSAFTLVTDRHPRHTVAEPPLPPASRPVSRGSVVVLVPRSSRRCRAVRVDRKDCFDVSVRSRRLPVAGDAHELLRVSTLPEVAGLDRRPARARLAVGAGFGLGLFVTTGGRVTISVQWLNAVWRNPPRAQAHHLP